LSEVEDRATPPVEKQAKTLFRQCEHLSTVIRAVSRRRPIAYDRISLRDAQGKDDDLRRDVCMRIFIFLSALFALFAAAPAFAQGTAAQRAACKDDAY
jgi:hypothetical protein